MMMDASAPEKFRATIPPSNPCSSSSSRSKAKKIRQRERREREREEERLTAEKERAGWWPGTFQDQELEAKFVRFSMKSNRVLHLRITWVSCVGIMVSIMIQDLVWAQGRSLLTHPAIALPLIVKVTSFVWHLLHSALLTFDFCSPPILPSCSSSSLYLSPSSLESDSEEEQIEKESGHETKSLDVNVTHSFLFEGLRHRWAITSYETKEKLLWVNTILLSILVPIRMLAVYLWGDPLGLDKDRLQPLWCLPYLFLLSGIIGFCYKIRYFYSIVSIVLVTFFCLFLEYAFFLLGFAGIWHPVLADVAPVYSSTWQFICSVAPFLWFFIFLVIVKKATEQVYRDLFLTKRKLYRGARQREAASLRFRQSQLDKAIAVSVNNTRKELIGYLFHEVRVPLNSIVLGLYGLLNCDENVKEEGKENEKAIAKKEAQPKRFRDADRKVLRMMQQSADVACKVFDDVINVQQINEEGGLQWIFDAFDLQEVVQRVAEVMQPSASDAKINLSVQHLSSDLPLILGDEIRVQQVVTTFIDNAIAYTPKGGNIVVTTQVLETVSKKKEEENSDNKESNNNKNNKNNNNKKNKNDGQKRRRKRLHRRSSSLVAHGEEVRVRVAVRDSGIGVSMEDRDKLFTPFVQIKSGVRGKKRKRSMQTGLGLSICARLIQSAGGRIGFIPLGDDGGSEKGSEFWFELTCRVAHRRNRTKQEEQKENESESEMEREEEEEGEKEKEREEGERKESLDGQQSNQGDSSDNLKEDMPSSNQPEKATTTTIKKEQTKEEKEKERKKEDTKGEEEKDKKGEGLGVLIVEDNMSARKLLMNVVKRKLKLSICHEAEDGTIALDRVKEHGISYYSLIFMDKEMPLMNGCQATMEMRNLGVTCPIIAVTGCALPEDVELLRQAGCDDVITKPVKVDRLLTVVEQQLLLKQDDFVLL